jgi:hypothetical protein
MRSVVDRLLVEEAETFCFRFECDDCLHFDDDAERCVHGYPTEAHRLGPSGALAMRARAAGSITFCKEFELGGAPRNRQDAPAGPPRARHT